MAGKREKWALVTGASSGIGSEFARLLAARGYAVALSARRKDRLETLAAELHREHGVRTLAIALDLAEPAAAADLYEEVARNGIELEVLVNNAGFGHWGKFAESPWEREREMIELNVRALVELTKRFLPGMVERRSGRVLNVASTAAFQPGPLMAVYFATKAFVLSFSEAVNEELRGTGVNVTTLCPGPTQSEFFVKAEAQEKQLGKGKLPDARQVAALGIDALFAGKRTVVHGARNRILAALGRIAPRSTVIAGTRKVLER